jgi:adenylate cyclase
MIELELTYLAKSLPVGLEKCSRKEVSDIYIPKAREHPTLRIRKNGDKYEMTKKEPVILGDSSKQAEHTIPLTEEEFAELQHLKGKRVRKIRYLYPIAGRIAEVDVFQDKLYGLVLVDVEFESEDEKAQFKMPDFCLADVTQEKFTAGGMLCGKSFKDIKEELKKYKYKKIFLQIG